MLQSHLALAQHTHHGSFNVQLMTGHSCFSYLCYELLADQFRYSRLYQEGCSGIQELLTADWELRGRILAQQPRLSDSFVVAMFTPPLYAKLWAHWFHSNTAHA